MCGNTLQQQLVSVDGAANKHEIKGSLIASDSDKLESEPKSDSVRCNSAIVSSYRTLGSCLLCVCFAGWKAKFQRDAAVSHPKAASWNAIKADELDTDNCARISSAEAHGKREVDEALAQVWAPSLHVCRCGLLCLLLLCCRH